MDVVVGRINFETPGSGASPDQRPAMPNAEVLVTASLAHVPPGEPAKPLAETARPRTVRVRIAVAVDYTGAWSAGGMYSSAADDADIRDSVFVGDLQDGEVYHWIEADVPIPVRESSRVIEGVVSGAEP